MAAVPTRRMAAIASRITLLVTAVAASAFFVLAVLFAWCRFCRRTRRKSNGAVQERMERNRQAAASKDMHICAKSSSSTATSASTSGMSSSAGGVELAEQHQQRRPNAAPLPPPQPQQAANAGASTSSLPGKAPLQEVLEYAEYLGMDPKEDADLLWIAEEALTSVEPEGWIEKMDPNGQPFYYNVSTGQSSRQHPLDEHYKSLYLKLKTQRMDALASSNEILASEILAAAKEEEEAQRIRRGAALKEQRGGKEGAAAHAQQQHETPANAAAAIGRGLRGPCESKILTADAVAVRDAPGKCRTRDETSVFL